MLGLGSQDRAWCHEGGSGRIVVIRAESAARARRSDLASGYANVVVLSPLGGRSQAPPEAGQFEGLRRPPEWGTDLAGQVEGLRKEGSHVEVITPDADSRAAMGTNQMDPATRIPAARAGFAQGK
jgi:NTE family protein